jgi:two-component system response regulator NreC
MATRVLIVDDHRLLRDAIAELIISEPGYEVVAAMADLDGIDQFIEQTDVVLLDLKLPGGGALEFVSRTAAEGRVHTILVSMYQTPEYVRSALAAGARGYVFKQSTEKHLLDAIAAVMGGRVYVDPSMVDYVSVPSMVTSSGTPGLTEREREVLVELARGMAYKDIAERLGIGVRTVETYRRRVTEKLGLRTRADLLRYATELKLLR